MYDASIKKTFLTHVMIKSEIFIFKLENLDKILHGGTDKLDFLFNYWKKQVTRVNSTVSLKIIDALYHQNVERVTVYNK